MARKFKTGCLTAGEWDGYWKASDEVPPLTQEEFEDATERLERVVVNHSDVIYVRGDNAGDRTQYVEILDPGKFSEKIIRDLHRWVRAAKNTLWRIVIPCGEPSQAIMIYPQVVFIGDKTFVSGGSNLVSEMNALIERRKKSQERR
jgi:hypothetical protein